MLIHGSLEALPSLDVGTSLNPKCSSSFRTPGLRLGTALAVDFLWESSWHGSWHSWDSWQQLIPLPLPFPLGKFTPLAKEKREILQLRHCRREPELLHDGKRGKNDKKWEESSWPCPGICVGWESVLGVENPELTPADPRIPGCPQHPDHSHREN